MSASRDVRSRSHRDASAKGRLTDRDRLVIQTVALHGAASRNHLMDLGFFTSISRANRRLRLLFDWKFLRRTMLASNPYSIESVYVLGRDGVAVARECTSIDSAELGRHAARQPERAYLEHQLGVLSLRIALMNVPDGVKVTQFLTEPECRHEYMIGKAGRTSRRIIKPDAFFELGIGESRRPFFLEYDRGKCSLPQMKSVFDRYGRYAKDGAYQDVYGDQSFEVLVVTTAGNRRIQHLAGCAKNQGVPVRFATMDEVLRIGFYAHIWKDSADKETDALVAGLTGGGLP